MQRCQAPLHVTQAFSDRLDDMNDEIEVLLNKVDAFAAGLNNTEQAMFAHLIADDTDDDVAGFNSFEAWPAKVIDIAPRKIETLNTFLSSGHTTGITSPADSLFSGVSGTGKT